MELANQIRNRRIEKGLSQEELAKAIFVSRQTISNWETDRTYPDVESLLLLSRLFDVPADELIGGDAEAMRRIVHDDAQKLRWLSWAIVVSMVLAIAFFAGFSAVWPEPAGIGNLTEGNVAGTAVFVPLWAVCMGCAIAAERIKARHDLATYREITAFVEDEEAVEGADAGFTRSHPLLTTVAKFLLGAGAGALVGVLVYKLISG